LPYLEKDVTGQDPTQRDLDLLNGDLHPVARPEPVSLGEIDVEPQGIRILRCMLLRNEAVPLPINTGHKADLSRNLDAGHDKKREAGGDQAPRVVTSQVVLFE